MDDEGDDNSSVASSTKKVAKKKHYPFDTPARLHPAFSEYSHLNKDTQNFAMHLSESTDIEAEVVVEQPKRRRALPPKQGKKGEGEEGEEKQDDDPFMTGGEDYQPCTKLPCQIILRSIADLQFRNQVERLDLEDEYEKLEQDIVYAQQDIVATLSRLDKLTEIGNSLEVNLQTAITKGQVLEKKKQGLIDERTEIASKMMLLEVERQKGNRLLEKASKALIDARWRKKKQAQKQDADAGLSFPISEIADSSITHCDERTVASGGELSVTKYEQLARANVVDYMERPPTVKTLPEPLQEDIFMNSEKFDKYSAAHYNRLVNSSLDSWDSLKGALITASVRSPSSKARKPISSQESHGNNNRSRLEMASISHHSMSSSISSAVSSRVGASLVSKTKGDIPRNNATATIFDHQQQISENMQKLMDYKSQNSQPLLRQLRASSSVASLSSTIPSSTAHNKAKLTPGVRKGGSTPVLTPIAGNPSSRPQSKVPSLGLSLLNLSSSEFDDEYNDMIMEKLAEAGINIPDRNDFPSSSTVANANANAKKLDVAFYRNQARVMFARKAPLGAIRTKPLEDAIFQLKPREKPSSGIEDNDKTSKKSNIGKERMKVDPRELPKLQSRTLTVKHPGMDTFDDSSSLRGS